MERDEAIALAQEYVDAHMFKKRFSKYDAERRNNASEAIRLGGMEKILQQLKETK